MNRALQKVVVVVGTTGAGKTKLSVELAKAFNGEIVNSDAMQMYRGLDIATAKASVDEMQGIKHHLLSCMDPVDECTVIEYKAQAMATIHDILSRGKVPVIVGGTMYYTQSILWKAQLIEEAAGVNGNDNAAIPADADAAYQALVQIDPEMAQRLHSRDVRRGCIGVKHSELIAKQAHENDEMLFDACMLWVDCDRSVLAQRLDDRVDTMVQAGLVLEIEALMDNIQHHLAASPIPLGQKGISQAIGFKEFRPYLEARAAGHDTATVLEQCIEQLKIGTRQYAKRQLTWIRNRIVPRNIPVYKLDTTDVAQWPTNVTAPAMAIVSAFLKNESIDVPACVATVDVDSADKKVKNLCEPCGNREFVGLAQWNEHLRSKGHRYHMKRLRLLETGQLFDRPPPKKPKDKTEGMEPKEMGGASATRSP